MRPDARPGFRRTTGWRTALLLLSMLFCVFVMTARVPAEDGALREYDVKAACLFNFAKYSDWPPGRFTSPGAPLVIGVLGEDPFGVVLDRIVKGRVANNRPIVIRRAGRVADLAGAHIVFVSASESTLAAQICGALEGASVLTVGDTPETAAHCIVNFSLSAGKTVFSVNLARANRAGVKISSKLLALAAAVTRAEPNAPR
jgi:YfiR/HmsC-like